MMERGHHKAIEFWALTWSVARCRNILPGFYSVLWTIHLPCDIAQSMQLKTLLRFDFKSSHLQHPWRWLGPKSRETGAETEG